MRVLAGPPLDVPEGTVGTTFFASAQRHADQVAFEWREGGTLRTLTYA